MKNAVSLAPNTAFPKNRLLNLNILIYEKEIITTNY